MKINEKCLSLYSTSSSPIDKEGWMMKKSSSSNKSFQRRWFTLKGNLLFYFEKKGDKEPIGVIILEGCTLQLDEDDELYCFKLVFHGPGCRTYVFGTDSQPSLEQWMKALACASYDYIKAMVAELQRQLNDLNEMEEKALELCGANEEVNVQQSNTANIFEITNHPETPQQLPRRPPRNTNNQSSVSNATSTSCRTNPFQKSNTDPGFKDSTSRGQPNSEHVACSFEPSSSASSSNSNVFAPFKFLHKKFGSMITEDQIIWRRKIMEKALMIEKLSTHSFKEDLLVTI